METMQRKRIEKYQPVVEDVERNHRHSLYHELTLRTPPHIGTALSYQGNEISYTEMLQAIDKTADALSAMGFKAGDEIPVCVSNCPEFVYLFFAISKIGAVVNSFGNWFAKDYHVRILNDSGSTTAFISDDNYALLQEALEESAIQNVVVFFLQDSLPVKDGVRYNPYQAEQQEYLPEPLEWAALKATSTKTLLDGSDFFSFGVGHSAAEADIDLHTPFAITYTSGTTDPLRPKAVVHSVESYLLISRFKDADVSGMGKMTNLRVLAHFPTYIHAGLTTAILDPLFESCTVILSPVYSSVYFPKQILELKPNFACASVASWTSLAQTLEARQDGLTLPFLMLACVTGEGMSEGEEKYFNYIAKKYKFGCERLPWPMSPVSFSIGGGTSESSGVFVTLFKKHQRMLPQYWFGRKPVGLTPLNFVAVDVIRGDGSSCKVGELGTIALSSPCNMLGYKYTPALSDEVKYLDADGRQWMKMGAIGVKLDDFVHIQIKGRPNDYILLQNAEKLWYHTITEQLYKRVPALMSCSIVRDAAANAVVVHAEKLPTARLSDEELYQQCAAVLRAYVQKGLSEPLYLRVRSNAEGFPAAVSGKRDFGALMQEGISRAKAVV